MQTNSSPAYKGARFNSRGLCTSHSDVRLCRIASDGSFHIIRKTCFKCGSAGLAGHAKKTKLHGCSERNHCRIDRCKASCYLQIAVYVHAVPLLRFIKMGVEEEDVLFPLQYTRYTHKRSRAGQYPLLR